MIMFNEFDEFDLACALYHWLQHNWNGQSDELYQAFCVLTEPGKYKPGLSHECFDNIDDSVKYAYDLFTRDNYDIALDRVLNYKSED